MARNTKKKIKADLTGILLTIYIYIASLSMGYNLVEFWINVIYVLKYLIAKGGEGPVPTPTSTRDPHMFIKE